MTIVFLLILCRCCWKSVKVFWRDRCTWFSFLKSGILWLHRKLLEELVCISNFQWWLLYNLHFIPGSSQLISNWRDIPVNSRKWMLFIKYRIINKEAGMSVKTSVYISPLTTGYLHQNWQIMFPKIRCRHSLSSGRKSLSCYNKESAKTCLVSLTYFSRNFRYLSLLEKVQDNVIKLFRRLPFNSSLFTIFVHWTKT